MHILAALPMGGCLSVGVTGSWPVPIGTTSVRSRTPSLTDSKRTGFLHFDQFSRRAYFFTFKEAHF